MEFNEENVYGTGLSVGTATFSDSHEFTIDVIYGSWRGTASASACVDIRGGSDELYVTIDSYTLHNGDLKESWAHNHRYEELSASFDLRDILEVAIKNSPHYREILVLAANGYIAALSKKIAAYHRKVIRLSAIVK